MGTASYRGPCDACRRTSALCPAPGTPDGAEGGNLYCRRCHLAGGAVCRKYAPPGELSAVAGIAAGLGILVLTAVGFVEFFRRG